MTFVPHFGSWDLGDRLVRFACATLVARLPSPRVFSGRTGVYLSRWTIVDRGKERWRLSLHHFHRSDEDQELHTHPWRWAVALQLAGGYVEERRVGNDVVRIRRGPCSLVFLRADTAHRVDLLDLTNGAWSFILTGPVVASWGFYDRRTWLFTPWREFIRAKGLDPSEPGRRGAT
jgi:hypothetical protein